MRIIKRVILNFLIIHCASTLLRARIFKLFGAKIGTRVKIEQVFLLNYDGTNLSNLVLSDRVYIGAGSILDIKEKIIIGDSVKIAAGCNFSTHVDCGQENYIFDLYPRRQEKLVVGAHTWIGLNVTILCGVSIGENSVIGSCSLINRDIPSSVLAFGNPAKVQKSLIL